MGKCCLCPQSVQNTEVVRLPCLSLDTCTRGIG